jgi:hypothetical protein
MARKRHIRIFFNDSSFNLERIFLPSAHILLNLTISTSIF